MSDDITMPKVLLQVLFDTAVGSMDFGSGFLDDEEVKALRQVAELLGVDPMAGTPYNYCKRMVHLFAPYDHNNSAHCHWCDKTAGDEVHAP